MKDTVVPVSTNKAITSTTETVVEGDTSTTITKTKQINPDHSVTITTKVDKTAPGEHSVTTVSETSSSSSSLDPELDEKIIRQIEYYLGDINLVRDKFLKNEITKDAGWIPLSVLTTFKRLQSLTTDFNTITSALKKSASGLLEVHDSEPKIRRHPDRPLPNSHAELELALRNRTVYVKGFPKTPNVTIDKLLSFFEKFGSVESVQMKKQFKSKEFNGSAFVVFSSDEKARQFVENSKMKPLTYEGGSVLECSLQDDFYKKKALESANGGKSMNDDDDNDVDIKGKRMNEKQVRKEKRKQELEKKTNEHLEKLNNDNLLGALIHLTGMTANVTRELIKEKFNPFTKMPWIDFNKGDAEAWVRLNEANTAKDVLEKVLAAGHGKLVIDNKEITCRVVEGEEEAQFWKEANEKRAAERAKKNDRQTGGKRNGRGQRNRRGGQKRKRPQDQNNDSESNEDEDDEISSTKKVKGTTDD